MFIKTTRSKGYEYVNLVESYKQGASTKHRVLYNFGRADHIRNNQSFINCVKRLCEIVELAPVEQRQRPDFSEAQFFNYGHAAYAKLWEKLGIGNCLKSIQQSTKIEFSLNNAAFLMALQHLLRPRSKFSTFEHQDNYFGLPHLELQHLYRTLDVLGEHKERIEAKLFDENYTKVGRKVDVVFYDVTTFAFESVIKDELRNFGFSKDCKFSEVQVVMGLLIDKNGLPVGYELFSGNTFDGKTMIHALENIKARFGISRVIIVADRGLNSKGNLHLIKQAGYGYIVSSRIKSMSSKIIEKILAEEGFSSLSDGVRYKIMQHVNTFRDEDGAKHHLPENLIITYSEKRAQKDAKDRRRLIDKAAKLLEDKALIKQSAKRGGKKYILQEGEQEYSLDMAAIEKDSRFDGYYGIQTSETKMLPEEILDAYHTLWKIEESFRIMKSTLQVRPVFHWKPSRIHGHFVICFLAFMLERRLELFLSEQDIDNSPENIREALLSMQVAKVTMNNEELFIKAKTTALATKIWQSLKITAFQNVSTKEELLATLTPSKKQRWGQLSLF